MPIPDFAALLSAYPRAIAHLRTQVDKKRFGLVLGSGISRGFGVPMWDELVQAIAVDDRVDGKALIDGAASKAAAPYRTEMLFQRFRGRSISLDPAIPILAQENDVVERWLGLCREKIYGGRDRDIEEALERHAYFGALLPLVRRSALTITFNFDDYLEESLALRKGNDRSRGFETVTDPWPQFRRIDSVIYHPHGFVPHRVMERTVDRFVFSEAGYSKQYVGGYGPDSTFMTAHFARNTCLLIGCSLEDELRNVLMRGAQLNPGNYHYYVHFLRPGENLPDEERQLLEETNFKVYNLNTLFLPENQIGLLLQLIDEGQTSDDILSDLASQAQASLKYTFYLTGPIGVGKSTTANLMRSLTVIDEWREARPENLAKPWDSLTPPERTASDDWIADQFRQKNDALRHDRVGIRVVDRPPLDPVTFNEKEERAGKARSLLDLLCPNMKWPVEPGVIVLLLGDPKELSARVIASGRRDYTAAKLEGMQDTMVELYRDKPGVVTIDARFLSIPELTKRVAEIIHRKPYEPADLTGMLTAIRNADDEPRSP